MEPSIKLKKPSISKNPITKVDKNRNSHSFFKTFFSTITGWIIAATASTKPILKMFEPNAFPILNSG